MGCTWAESLSLGQVATSTIYAGTHHALEFMFEVVVCDVTVFPLRVHRRRDCGQNRGREGRARQGE